MRSTTVLVALAMIAVGCTSTDVGSTEGYLIETGHCAVSGSGTIDANAFGGDVHDVSGTPAGTWTHTSAGGDSFEATSTTELVCRVNGSRVGTISGFGTWNGVPGHEFRVEVQDRGGASPPVRVHGTPETPTLTATRYYSPSRWVDGSLSWTDGAEVVIPDALPVTVGNAGNQWARLTFVDYHTGLPIRCSYRGGASTANPTRRADVAAGLSYDFAFCEVWSCEDEDLDDDSDEGEGRRGGHHGCGGHDEDDEDDECGWERDPSYVPGASIDSASVDLHVQHGSSRYPSRHAAQTTVAVVLDVTPYIALPHEPDAYLLRVFAPGGGPAIYSLSADLTGGDLTVSLLP